MDIDKQKIYSSFFILVHKIKDLIILLPLIKCEQTSSLRKWLCIVNIDTMAIIMIKIAKVFACLKN
jgi:hypothetical protein